MNISVDTSRALPFLEERELEQIRPETDAAWNTLLSGSGPGGEFLGWLRLPSQTGDGPTDHICRLASRIREMADIFIVTGIGGSYLGARGVIEALSPSFASVQRKEGAPLVLYAGENLSGEYHAGLLDLMDNHPVAVAVISKSGTTTEPAVAFRLVRQKMEEKYGREGARKRIIAITDPSRGALKEIAGGMGYETLVIPGDVGGRFSVLTPVGLLPAAVAGVDIRRLMEGALVMEKAACSTPEYGLNPATLYAAIRNLLYRKGKFIEIMVTFQPRLAMLTEWWKQLFGESEGKAGKGIFPAGATFTTDLHSLGQFIQDGPRNIFETVLSAGRPALDVTIPEDRKNTDGINFLAGKSIEDVNRLAEEATILAHMDGGIPIIRIAVPCLDEFHLGQLLYFYEFSCGISGYTLGVNPFDQPGVEAYKRNIFALLGKPGFEKETEDIKNRV